MLSFISDSFSIYTRRSILAHYKTFFEKYYSKLYNKQASLYFLVKKGVALFSNEYLNHIVSQQSKPEYY